MSEIKIIFIQLKYSRKMWNFISSFKCTLKTSIFGNVLIDKKTLINDFLWVLNINIFKEVN